MIHALVTKQANVSFPTIFFISELCPHPWIYIEGFCYKFSSQSLTWNESKTACKNMESTLAVLDSNENQIEIAAILIDQSRWIGLYRDPEDTSRWLWIDSSRLCKRCRHWSRGQPNNYKNAEGCGEMRTDGKWNENSCLKKRRYICQKRGWYYSFVSLENISSLWLIVWGKARAFAVFSVRINE